jgi:hypothetical protein
MHRFKIEIEAYFHVSFSETEIRAIIEARKNFNS